MLRTSSSQGRSSSHLAQVGDKAVPYCVFVSRREQLVADHTGSDIMDSWVQHCSVLGRQCDLRFEDSIGESVLSYRVAEQSFEHATARLVTGGLE